mgnify:CR=1 FL=1
MSRWRRDDTIEIALEKAERLIHDRGVGSPRGRAPTLTPIGIGIAPGQPTYPWRGARHRVHTYAPPRTREGLGG